MPKTEAELYAFLADLGISVSTVRHPPLFTVADSQALRGEIPGGQVKVVLDQALMDHEVINGHPLTNEATTAIAAADLVRFVEATGHDPAILKVS